MIFSQNTSAPTVNTASVQSLHAVALQIDRVLIMTAKPISIVVQPGQPS